MELIQVANFLNGRYLLSNLKKDRKEMLKSDLLSSFSVDPLGSSNNEKIYYDTNEFFFAEHGINIYTVTIDKNAKELVVRYDAEQVKRIEFLKNTPNFFKIKINKADDIKKYYNQINDAIYKVYPSGLSANIEEMLRASVPQIRILKKRDSYRVVNNQGLKTTISYDVCTYLNARKKQKASQDTLDIVCESFKSKDDFNLFLKSIIRDFPQLIKLPSNELTLAKSLL